MSKLTKAQSVGIDTLKQAVALVIPTICSIIGIFKNESGKPQWSLIAMTLLPMLLKVQKDASAIDWSEIKPEVRDLVFEEIADLMREALRQANCVDTTITKLIGKTIDYLESTIKLGITAYQDGNSIFAEWQAVFAQ